MLGFQQPHTECYQKGETYVAPSRTSPLKLSLFLQCNTNARIKGVWHTVPPPSTQTQNFPIAYPLSLYTTSKQSPAQPTRAMPGGSAGKGQEATAWNPGTKATTTVLCLRRAGAKGWLLHHTGVTQPQPRPWDISVLCYCLQKGPKTVLTLNYTTVKRVWGYAGAAAREFSYVWDSWTGMRTTKWISWQYAEKWLLVLTSCHSALPFYAGFPPLSNIAIQGLAAAPGVMKQKEVFLALGIKKEGNVFWFSCITPSCHLRFLHHPFIHKKKISTSLLLWDRAQKRSKNKQACCSQKYQHSFNTDNQY